jgi:hypothetical protein
VAKRLARHFTFGRSRVLNPVPPDQVWVFFGDFPTPSHIGMSNISYKANAGSVSTSQYQHLPSAPILTVPIPNLPVSVAEKALESLSSPHPFGGKEKCILSFFPRKSIFSAPAQLLLCEDDYLGQKSDQRSPLRNSCSLAWTTPWKENLLLRFNVFSTLHLCTYCECTISAIKCVSDFSSSPRENPRTPSQM